MTSFPHFYYDFANYVQAIEFRQNFEQRFSEMAEKCSKLEQNKIELEKKIIDLEHEAEYHKRQINSLRKQIHKKEKRSYSRRRDWLQKKFRCQVPNCDSKYSSQVALNCHIKKKHRQSFEFQRPVGGL